MTTKMTTLNAQAREELGLPHMSQNGETTTSSYLHMSQDSGTNSFSKTLAISPRTLGMEDLRDFCGPLGNFKTGLTPRFSTGLTPRSGFTPRIHTGFTPRIGGSSQPDTNAFFSRSTGFSPRPSEMNNKISPTGFTPKDVSGMKMPMRFPGTFTSSPQKPGMMEHLPMHKGAPSHMHLSSPEMNGMNMAMFDYVNRNSAPANGHSNVSPMSEKNSNQDELDERRRMKNRERVRKCRKRKQDRLNFLEDRTSELEKENQQLKNKLARKGTNGETLTEAQFKELRKKQNTTIAAYIRAYNESDAAFETAARSIWSDNAEIISGVTGSCVTNVDAIISNKKASAALFTSYNIKQYTVHWRTNSNDKCSVNWEVEVVLAGNAPADLPLTAPFGTIASSLQGETLTFQMVSHLTFDEGKIVEELRQINTSRIADVIFSMYNEEPAKAFGLFKSLTNA
jgi:hypothetical protein